MRGVEEVRIRLATVQPANNWRRLNDALRRMSNPLTYLYTMQPLLYDTRPTVNRMAQDPGAEFMKTCLSRSDDRLRAMNIARGLHRRAHRPRKFG